MKRLNLIFVLLLFFFSCKEDVQSPQKNTSKILDYLKANGATITHVDSKKISFSGIQSYEKAAALVNGFYTPRGVQSVFNIDDIRKRVAARMEWECSSGPMYCIESCTVCQNFLCVNGDEYDLSTTCVDLDFECVDEEE